MEPSISHFIPPLRSNMAVVLIFSYCYTKKDIKLVLKALSKQGTAFYKNQKP